MAPEAFWIFLTNRSLGMEFIYSGDNPALVTSLSFNIFPIQDSQKLGRFFLSYAYSTPAGTAYRLAYGIGRE